MSKKFNDIRFNEKALPQWKKIVGSKNMYQLTDASFSESDMDKEAERLRKMGFKIRKLTFKRAGKTVYALYKGGNKKPDKERELSDIREYYKMK
jgi:site-specific recombinase XerD